jgi:hypothetical protein
MMVLKTLMMPLDVTVIGSTRVVVSVAVTGAGVVVITEVSVAVVMRVLVVVVVCEHGVSQISLSYQFCSYSPQDSEWTS